MLFGAEQLLLVTHLGCRICVSCPKAEEGRGAVCSAASESISTPQANPLWKLEAMREAQIVGKLLNSHCFLLILSWLVTGLLHPPGSAAPCAGDRDTPAGAPGRVGWMGQKGKCHQSLAVDERQVSCFLLKRGSCVMLKTAKR